MQQEDSEKTDLDKRQLDAIAMLAAGETVTATADKIDVDRGTIRRWRKQDAFKEALSEELRTQVEESRLRLAALMPSAIDALKKTLARGGIAAERVARMVFEAVDREHPAHEDDEVIEITDPPPGFFETKGTENNASL